METITIQISGWKKYNPRKDVEHPSWFRFQHDFFEHWQFYDFTDEERLAWVYLLCESSKRNQDGKVTVNFDHAHRVAKLSSTAIKSAIKKLKANRVLEVRTLRGRYADVKETGTTRRTGRDETDETNGTDSSEQAPPVVAIGPFAANKKLVELFQERDVNPEVQQKWLDAYPDPSWVSQEILKAVAWEAANPKKRKKDFARFMTNWLARDWDKHTSRLPSNKPGAVNTTPLTLEEIA